MSISEFVQIFLSICGGVSIVGGAAAVIFKWIAPAFRLNKRVERLEEHDKRDYESLQRFWKCYQPCWTVRSVGIM